jgi:hypothetical protein
MVFGIITKIFSIFKKNKKEEIKREAIIPEHRKQKLLNEKRKEDVKELKQAHETKKTEEKVVNAIHETIADKKLKDIDFENETEISLFKVNGIYSIGPTQMLTGFLETGRLKKGMKAIVNEVNIKILEIRKNNSSVDDLLPGQEATLIISAKKNPLLRQDDYLEFE